MRPDIDAIREKYSVGPYLANAEIATLLDYIKELEAVNGEAVGLLRESEFAFGDTGVECLQCGRDAYWHKAHAPDCPLAALLAKVTPPGNMETR